MNKRGNNKNLKPRWKPGTSGNPKGRPKKGATWGELAKSLGDMTPDDVRSWVNALGRRLPAGAAGSVTLRELAMLSAYIDMIHDPNPRMLVAMRETEEGRLPEAVQLSGNSDKPVTIRVVREAGPLAVPARGAGEGAE